jgi:hypothetical protein
MRPQPAGTSVVRHLKLSRLMYIEHLPPASLTDALEQLTSRKHEACLIQGQRSRALHMSAYTVACHEFSQPALLTPGCPANRLRYARDAHARFLLYATGTGAIRTPAQHVGSETSDGPCSLVVELTACSLPRQNPTLHPSPLQHQS